MKHSGQMTRFQTYPRWIYYPNWSEPPSWVHSLVQVFADSRKALDSRAKHKTSNEALALVRTELEKLGYVVERSTIQKIHRPVHFGEYGQADRSYQIDSYHPEYGIALEVEAGRTIRVNAIYRDIIQTSLLVGVRYFALAVPQLYKFKASGKEITDSTYESCRSLFDAIFSSERFKLPMEGILLIGY